MSCILQFSNGIDENDEKKHRTGVNGETREPFSGVWVLVGSVAYIVFEAHKITIAKYFHPTWYGWMVDVLDSIVAEKRRKKSVKSGRERVRC